MLSILINLIFIAAILWRYSKDEPTIGIFLLLSIISPRISIGGAKVDGIYLVTVCVAIAIFIKCKGRIHRIEGYFKIYVVLIVGIHLLYFTSWVLFNRNDSSRLITTMMGAIKHIILLFEVIECNINIKKLDIKKEIITFFSVAIFFNIVALLYEIIDYKGAVALLSNTFFNEEETDFLTAQIHNGFSRYNGLFSYPMGLGMFACYALAYLISVEKVNKTNRIVLIAFSLVLGLYSASKSFIIGTAIILLTFLLLNLIKTHIPKKSIYIIGGLLALIVSIFIFYDSIYAFIYTNIGPGFARYFQYLKNTQGILHSRLDTDSGALLPTMEVIKEHWFIGVGPTSIAGEPVMDNSYIVILHNGGICALFAIIIFYLKLLIKTKPRAELFLLIIAVLSTGMGFPTVFVSDTSFWVITFILWELTFNADKKTALYYNRTSSEIFSL